MVQTWARYQRLSLSNGAATMSPSHMSVTGSPCTAKRSTILDNTQLSQMDPHDAPHYAHCVLYTTLDAECNKQEMVIRQSTVHNTWPHPNEPNVANNRATTAACLPHTATVGLKHKKLSI